MKEYILTNLMQIINIFVSLVIAGVGIWGGYKLNSKQNSNNIELEKLRDQMTRKGRIFEDKYSKTIKILEQMGELHMKLNKFKSYMVKMKPYDKDYSRSINTLYDEFVNTRNHLIAYSKTCRYWIGNDLVSIMNEFGSSTELLCDELFKFCNGLDLYLNRTTEEEKNHIESYWGDFDPNVVNTKTSEFINIFERFEIKCMHKYKE